MASPKRSLKKAHTHAITGRQTGRINPYTYEIRDINFGVLQVKNTSNGWWLDRSKVQRLIDAFKIGSTDEEACLYAGVSLNAFKYFIVLHPEFAPIKKQLKDLPILVARQTVVNNLAKDANLAMRYLEKKRRDEFGASVDITSGGQQIGGNQIEFVDFHDPKD